MGISALLLTLGVIVLVGIYLYAPFLERRARVVTEEEHELSALLAERDRVISALQELEFDFTLGKIPDTEFPNQRASLMQKGADILRKIDTYPIELQSDKKIESRIEKAISSRRKKTLGNTHELNDNQIEDMIVARKKSHKQKSGGFCPYCGKPVLASDKFCPSCGRAL